MIKRRSEYMFDNLDYRSDRYRLRSRFLLEYNKEKVSLKDIGQLLDKFIIDEKAEPQFARFAATQEVGSDNLSYPSKD